MSIPSNILRVKCDSGIEGWMATVQENWVTLGSLRDADENYGICQRLGYESIAQLWEENPVVQGSVYPPDLRLSMPTDIAAAKA